jgi:hypothetical protein
LQGPYVRYTLNPPKRYRPVVFSSVVITPENDCDNYDLDCRPVSQREREREILSYKCYIKLIDLVSGRRPEFSEIYVILEDRLSCRLFLLTRLLHEAMKKRERNARRATVRDACFIYNRGGVRARCRAASGRDARVEYYARPATLLSSLTLSLSRVRIAAAH